MKKELQVLNMSELHDKIFKLDREYYLAKGFILASINKQCKSRGEKCCTKH